MKVKSSKAPIVILIILASIPILLLVGFFVSELSEGLDYEIKNSVLEINSMLYNKDISLENAQIELKTDILNLKKIVGTGTSKLKKGTFKNIDINEEVYAMMLNYGGSYIEIDDGAKYYINGKNEKETLELYELLCNELK